MKELLPWDEIVDIHVQEEELSAICIASSEIDQLNEALQNCTGANELLYLQQKLDEWILYLSSIQQYWILFGTGEDEEEWANERPYPWERNPGKYGYEL